MRLNKRDQKLGTIITFFAIVLFFVYLIFITFGNAGELVLLVSFATALIVAFCICYLTTRSYRRQQEPGLIDYFNVGTQRHVLGLLMIFYGLPKLTGNFFDYQLFALDSKMADVSEFELAWYYFGKNRWQELFSGLMEFLPGILLLNRRTYYIASLILMPVTAQVFILNFFFKIGGITFPAALILLACNLYIIYSEKEKILIFLRSLDFRISVQVKGRTLMAAKLFRICALVIAVLLVMLRVKPLLFKSDYQQKYQQLVGVYALDKIKKNGVDFSPGKDSLIYKDLYIEKQERWNMLRKCDNKTDAFILNLNPKNDSISIYINKGGAGDEADIPDSLTVLKGRYTFTGHDLFITGIQLNDTLQLSYKKQQLKPKEWFW